MSLRRSALLTVLVAVAGCDAAAPGAEGPIDLAQGWVESTPEAVGLDAVAVDRFEEALAAIPRVRSTAVVAGGRLVAERYGRVDDPSTRHDVRSVTKSVVGLLTGIAVDRGHLTLETRVADVLAGHPSLRPEHGAITVGHLLTMSGGFAWDEGGGDDYAQLLQSRDYVSFLLDRPVAAAPGTAFVYNSAGAHLLGVVVAEAVGQPLDAFAAEALFGPLGITDVLWEREPGPEGRAFGGAGIDLRTRDLARLGQLVLQRGVSGGRAVVSPGWVDASLAPAFDWRAQGGPLTAYSYGRLWWVETAAPRVALAWGYGGQFVAVAPDQDLVVVVTTDWRGLDRVPNGERTLWRAVLGPVLELVAEAR